VHTRLLVDQQFKRKFHQNPWINCVFDLINQIESAIKEICSELNLFSQCIFSTTNEELIKDGYHALHNSKELSVTNHSTTLKIKLDNNDEFSKDNCTQLDENENVSSSSLEIPENRIREQDSSFQSPIEKKS